LAGHPPPPPPPPPPQTNPPPPPPPPQKRMKEEKGKQGGERHRVDEHPLRVNSGRRTVTEKTESATDYRVWRGSKEPRTRGQEEDHVRSGRGEARRENKQEGAGWERRIKEGSPKYSAEAEGGRKKKERKS